MQFIRWISCTNYGIIVSERTPIGMIEVTQELRGEISGLQWLDARQLKERYADLLADGMRCERIEFLRSVIAFRLQERFYGTRVSEASMKLIQHAVEGDLFKSPGRQEEGVCDAADPELAWRGLCRDGLRR